MNSQQRAIQLTLMTARAYVLLSRSMQSPVYFKKACETMALARILIQTYNKDVTRTISFKLVG